MLPRHSLKRSGSLNSSGLRDHCWPRQTRRFERRGARGGSTDVPAQSALALNRPGDRNQPEVRGAPRRGARRPRPFGPVVPLRTGRECNLARAARWTGECLISSPDTPSVLSAKVPMTRGALWQVIALSMQIVMITVCLSVMACTGVGRASEIGRAKRAFGSRSRD